MSATKEQRPSDQELVTRFNTNKQNLQALANKLGDLERDADEHTLVLETLEGTEPSRKCFRMIDEVLVERTVSEVVPSLKATLDMLKESMKNVMEVYQRKEKEQSEFIKKYNIQVKG